MRKIIIDFYLTVLLPLFGIGVVSLWNSIRLYRSANRFISRAPKYLEEHPEQNTPQFAEERKDEENRKRLAKRLIQISAGGVLALLALVLVGDGIKLEVIGLIWFLLRLISFVSFLVSFGMSWHYARKRQWIPFTLTVLAILLAAASTEHFIHQTINTERINCPDCSDDEHYSDNNYW